MRAIIAMSIFSAVVAIATAPAIAGEVTGNGKSIEINGRSICAFSGRNDTPDGLPPLDPGGAVQSYGYLVGQWDLFDPQDADPHVNGLPVPGYSCNPNRGEDLNARG